MNMLERLERLMSQKAINKRQLAINTGIPPTTVYGWWDKGFENMTLPTLRKLSSYFNCSLEYLINGSDSLEGTIETVLSTEELDIIRIYRNLSLSRQKLFLSVVSAFANNPDTLMSSDLSAASNSESIDNQYLFDNAKIMMENAKANMQAPEQEKAVK